MENQKETYGLRDFVSNARTNGILKALGTDVVKTFKQYIPTEYGDQTWRQDVGGFTCAAGIFGALGAIVFGPFIISNKIEEVRRDGQLPLVWEQFMANHDGYKVEIDESYNKNGSKCRLLHLKAIDEKTVPNGITGHDYDLDGNFERVFIMDKKYDSCDSVVFTSKGVVWDPSNSSRDKGKAPFTEEKIAKAQIKLYDALANVRTEKNKFRYWTPGKGNGIIKDHPLNQKIKAKKVN